jgi:uncharacterized damage-inducible protein DinB
MSRATRLAKQIERTVTGPMWHGPALADVLDGVTHEHAAARPIPSAHSIWELVLHIAAWAEIAHARVHGESIGDPTPDQDWPPPPLSGADPNCGSDPVWRLAIERMRESYRRLAAAARELGDDQLDARVTGLEYSVDFLLRGVVEHGTYHGGQIALLRKAL